MYLYEYLYWYAVKNVCVHPFLGYLLRTYMILYDVRTSLVADECISGTYILNSTWYIRTDNTQSSGIE